MSSVDGRGVFEAYRRKKGIRFSRQRRYVLDIFLSTEKHVTTAELYDLVRREHPKISHTTVYRALKVICGAGVARKVAFGDGVTRFEHDYGHEHHDHLVCLECGRFIETVSPAIEKHQERMAKKHGFEVMSHRLQIFGFCRKCRKKK